MPLLPGLGACFGQKILIKGPLAGEAARAWLSASRGVEKECGDVLGQLGEGLTSSYTGSSYTGSSSSSCSSTDPWDDFIGWMRMGSPEAGTELEFPDY